MGDLELGAAYAAVDGVLWPILRTWRKDPIEAVSRASVDAALPHIERAVIERLIWKYEAKAREGSIYIDGVRQRSMFDKTVALLRAELEGDGE